MTKKDDDLTPLASVALVVKKWESLGKACGAMGLFAGAVIWLTCVWRDVQDLKRDVAEIKSALHILPPAGSGGMAKSDTH